MTFDAVTLTVRQTQTCVSGCRYNAVRFFFTCVFGLLIGAIYWRKGQKRWELFHKAVHWMAQHKRAVLGVHAFYLHYQEACPCY